MAFKGEKKKEYQRQYMKGYMRRKRHPEIRFEGVPLYRSESITYDPEATDTIFKFDADGQIIPEYE